MTERIDTQFICRAQPACLCAGTEYSCDCDRNPATNICGDCGQPMEEIETDSGEPVGVG